MDAFAVAGGVWRRSEMLIELKRSSEFAVMTINRMEALNALSFAMLREIAAALDEAGHSDARALLIIGAGTKAFCAGADIQELTGRRLMDEKRGAELGQAVFAKIDTLPMPSVAIINGYAFGGGLEIALACTFRLATRNAKMGLPEIKLGLIPGYGGTWRLPRLIGEARALEITMTGRSVGVEEAERIGLVNRIVEGDPLEAGMAFACEFTCFSLPALGFLRESVSRAAASSLHDGLKTEAALSTLAYEMEDAAEGMTAYLEKRKPKFRDC